MGPKRRNEMWTSNNRVLNGGNKKYNGRNPNFDTEETKLLISLWGDPKVQKTLITTHKKHPVIARLAEQLREYGYNRTAEEINTRIKNLKCFYNRIKKDIEVGIITEPTWKHFRAMERIMTRPIFSVRPNEIPKPSPRFRMEGLVDGLDVGRQGKENRDCTRDFMGNENLYNDCEDIDDDEEELFTQEMLEAEMDCDVDEYLPPGDDDIAAIECEVESHDESRTSYENAETKQTDENEEANAATELITPKQEPIDVDDEEHNGQAKDENRDADDANEIFPKLSAYLQLANNNQSTASSTKSTNKIITTIAGSNSTNPPEVNSSTSNPVKITQPMVLAQQQSAQGKISLVPTNILLKPPQQQIQLRPQAQHIIYNPGLAGNPTIATSAAGQMANGMKVLLVNTLPKSGVSSMNATNDVQPKIITSNAMKANCITSTVPHMGELRTKAIESRNQKMPPGNGTGFRTLISQLISIQTQNLEVSRQRLEVERQRLDFEKSVAERVIAALPHIFMPPPLASQNDERSTPAMPLLTPKIEKED